MRWNSNCPPERANGRYPSSSSTIRSSRDSCAARVPPLPIRVSSSRRVTNYEFWIVGNHPLFTDERCWQRARDVVRSEHGNRCAVDLRIYAKSDIRVAKTERDTFILDRIEAGITLYRASRDAPLGGQERGRARP